MFRSVICWFLLILTEISSKKVPKSNGFKVGKLPAGSFEYVELSSSGLFTPASAQSACDADPQCAGFSYRGARSATQKFNVRFHRFVHSEVFREVGDTDWHWTSYRTNRSFVLLPGTFSSPPSSSPATDVEARDVLKLLEYPSEGWKFDHPAIQVDVLTGKGSRWLKSADFSSLVKSKEGGGGKSGRAVTLVSADADVQQVKDSSAQELDRCCKKSETDFVRKMTSVLREVSPLRCSEPDFSFRRDFARMSRPAVVRDCPGAVVCSKEGFDIARVAKELEHEEVEWTVQDGSDLRNVNADELKSLMDENKVANAEANCRTEAAAAKMLRAATEDAAATVEALGGPRIRSLAADLELVEENTAALVWVSKGKVMEWPYSELLDLKLTVVAGKATFILLPFNRASVKNINCDKKCSKNTNMDSFLGQILPQLGRDFSYDGRRAVAAEVEAGQSVYVPAEWASVTVTAADEDVAFVRESALTSRNLESFAMTLSPVDMTVLSKKLMTRDDLRGEYFRLTELLKQLQKATTKKAKKKANKKHQ